MSFYCITIFYLRHSVSLRLLFGVFGKVVISASRRMFVNNSSIFFGALSSYFKAGAGQRYISAGSTAVQGKKPDTPSLDALCLLERSVTLPFVSLMKVKLVAFFPLSGRCTICSQMEQLLSLTLSEWQTTFNLLRKMYRVQCYYFLLQTFVLFLPLTVEFTTRQANRVVLFFFFLLQKRSHLQPHDFHVQLASGCEISSAKANPNTYYILPTTNISNNYKNKK